MHILFITSEVAGVFKLGGLADVCQSLPKALGELGHRVTILLPFYSDIDTNETTCIGQIDVTYDDRVEHVDVYAKDTHLQNVTLLLLKHTKLDAYHGKNIFDTFIFFSFVAASLCSDHTRLLSGPIDVVHCHDWHTALVPVLLNYQNKKHGSIEQSKISRVPTILTIHNLMYSGIVRDEDMKRILLNIDYWNDPRVHAARDITERKNVISLLREGLESCTVITTVSPTYAKEITVLQDSVIGDVLVRRKTAMFGILNGIDVSIWNPNKDKKIQYIYESNSVENIKKLNKKYVQELAHLKTDSSFLLGFVGRIEPHQKGIDITIEALSTYIKNKNIQLIILGTGDDKTEENLRKFSSENSERICFINMFDDKIAHQIYAGCDALLVPSKFEPCGLTQLIAMRYGTLPIVRKTGGLADTVTDSLTGFVFDEYTSHALAEKISEAHQIWREDPLRWSTIMQNAMHSDFSWEKSAVSYVDLYTSMCAFSWVRAS